jgi:hypothetical protein
MKIKFDAFLKHAIKQNSSHFLATGHYAQTLVNPMTGLQLGTAHDPTKDQTYFLAGLGQDVLSRVCFPVGNLSKRQVKDIAVHAGFTQSARRAWASALLESSTFQASSQSTLTSNQSCLWDLTAQHWVSTMVLSSTPLVSDRASKASMSDILLSARISSEEPWCLRGYV